MLLSAFLACFFALILISSDEVVADLIGRLPYAVEVVEMMMKPSSH